MFLRLAIVDDKIDDGCSGEIRKIEEKYVIECLDGSTELKQAIGKLYFSVKDLIFDLLSDTEISIYLYPSIDIWYTEQKLTPFHFLISDKEGISQKGNLIDFLENNSISLREANICVIVISQDNETERTRKRIFKSIGTSYSGWIKKTDKRLVDKILNVITKKKHTSTNCPKIRDQEKIISTILHLFLPLDIDMQAMKTTKNPKDYLNDMYADLEDLYNLDKYKGRDKNDHYRQKLYDLWDLLELSKENKRRASPEAKKLTSIGIPDALLKLAGLSNGNPKESPIYKFLGVLDTGKKDDMDVTAEDLCKPFNLEIEVNGKKEEINSFHNWYCALASCLRGAEKAVKGSN